jgi:ABC-type multidrug transport system fused ATPase/permease subunit
MLLGNSLSAISLSMNALLTSFVDNNAELELMLSFGGTKYEAAGRLVREAIRTGSMPTLNSMAVIGLISIPGMMTGQILGGSPPMEAARYQILIMYLIASCSFFSMISIVFISMQIIFDKHHRLRVTILVNQKKKKAKKTSSRCQQWCPSLHSICCGSGQSVDPESESLLTAPSKAATATTTTNGMPFTLHTIKRGAGAITPTDYKYLEVANLCHYVPFATDSYGSLDEKVHTGNSAQAGSGCGGKKMRALFENLNVTLEENSITLIQGPSGCGKSQFLRMLAHLEECKHGRIAVGGRSLVEDYDDDATTWRGDVRYVSQTRPGLPGTPRDFLARMCLLKGATQFASEYDMLESMKTYLGTCVMVVMMVGVNEVMRWAVCRFVALVLFNVNPPKITRNRNLGSQSQRAVQRMEGTFGGGIATSCSVYCASHEAKSPATRRSDIRAGP